MADIKRATPELWSVAWRNITRTSRRTWLTACGIAFAILLMTFVRSLQVGAFIGAVDNSARIMLGHIQLQHPDYEDDPTIENSIHGIFNIIADRGMEYFLCECQNDPPDEITSVSEIRPHIIGDKVNGAERGILPEWTERVTMFIDVHDAKLYWTAVAWRQGFIGYIVDYGVDPVHSPIAGSVTAQQKKKQTELAIIDALDVLRKKAQWPMDGTGEIKMPDLGLVDAGYKDVAVYAFIRSVTAGIWRPAKGGAGRTGSYKTPKKSKTVRGIGSGFHHSFIAEKRIWLIIHDSNKWKRRVQDGFVIGDVDAEGSLSLWGDDPVEHRAFAEQIVAEAYDTEKMRYEEVRGYRHNHWLDCMAGCCLAAEILGVRLIVESTPPPAKQDDGQIVHQGKRKMRRNY